MNRAIIQLSFDHVKVSVGCLLFEESVTKVVISVIFCCCFLLLFKFESFFLEFIVVTINSILYQIEIIRIVIISDYYNFDQHSNHASYDSNV